MTDTGMCRSLKVYVSLCVLLVFTHGVSQFRAFDSNLHFHTKKHIRNREGPLSAANLLAYLEFPLLPHVLSRIVVFDR